MGRRTSLAALALTGLMLTAGCGLTDDPPRPGVAAEVGGETLELDTVDDAVGAYCALLAERPEEPPVPVALVRAQVTLLWSRSIAIDAVAEQYDVPVPAPLDEGAVRASWEGLGEIDDDDLESFTWLSEVQSRDGVMIEAIGTAAHLEESGQAVVGDDAWNHGNELVAAWLDENEPDLNPLFGEVDWATGAVAPDRLSVPVSEEARGLLDISALSDDQVAALPADQRCGAAPPPQVKPTPLG